MRCSRPVDPELQQKVPFIVQEYVRGQQLWELLRIATRGFTGLGVPPGIAAFITREMARGLGHAHTHKDADSGRLQPIIHRDISPENVMVSVEGQIKVIDFGVAKALGGFGPQTRTGIIKGKLAYMAPEQVAQKVVPATDVFGAGIVLHEMLTGRRLFGGHNDFMVISRVLKAEIPRPSQLQVGIPKELDDVVMTALSRDLKTRYLDGNAFADALTRVMAKLPEMRGITTTTIKQWSKQVVAEGVKISSNWGEEESGVFVDVDVTDAMRRVEGSGDDVIQLTADDLMRAELDGAFDPGVRAAVTQGLKTLRPDMMASRPALASINPDGSSSAPGVSSSPSLPGVARPGPARPEPVTAGPTATAGSSPPGRQAPPPSSGTAPVGRTPAVEVGNLPPRRTPAVEVGNLPVERMPAVEVGNLPPPRAPAVEVGNLPPRATPPPNIGTAPVSGLGRTPSSSLRRVSSHLALVGNSAASASSNPSRSSNPSGSSDPSASSNPSRHSNPSRSSNPSGSSDPSRISSAVPQSGSAAHSALAVSSGPFAGSGPPADSGSANSGSAVNSGPAASSNPPAAGPPAATAWGQAIARAAGRAATGTGACRPRPYWVSGSAGRWRRGGIFPECAGGAAGAWRGGWFYRRWPAPRPPGLRRAGPAVRGAPRVFRQAGRALGKADRRPGRAGLCPGCAAAAARLSTAHRELVSTAAPDRA